MKIFDLSHTICSDMPVYPGTEKPKLIPVASYEKDDYRETKLCMYSHTGTHIDSPAHLFEGKASLDQFPISQFIGKALVIDCTSFSERDLIPLSHLDSYGEKVVSTDFLLFRFGCDKKWGSDDYFKNFPLLAPDLLDFIIDRHYKGIGFDVISLDSVFPPSLERHKRLFESRNMINIENLCNLECFGDQLFTFCCFPLKIINSDGAPCRAVGWID